MQQAADLSFEVVVGRAQMRPLFATWHENHSECGRASECDLCEMPLSIHSHQGEGTVRAG